jgi:hypothetical protein
VCAVFDPLNVPQLEALQLRDQSTPAPAESLATTATSEAECAEPEVSTLTVTATGGGSAVIVSVAVADLVVSVSEVAAIVTVPPVGTAVGAVYVVEAAESVVDNAGLNDPQALVGPQVAVQITPAPNGSLVTVALRLSVALVSRRDGTVVVMATPIDDATMVRLTLLLCDRLLVTVAVIVIVV